MLTWIVLTGEYPPDCGGVGDYTARLGAALASCGDRVLVCVPARRDGGTLDRITGVDVLELPDRFGPRAREVLARTLDAGAARLLVQYVPNAFGVRGTNLSWCRWLLQRAREQRDDVRVMFHEPYFYFEWNRPDRAVLAVSQRTMAVMLLRAASHVYMSTRSWERYLRPYASSRFTPVTLPIPATLPDASADPAVPAARGAWLDGRASTLVGHFGTYGSHVAPALRWLLPRLLRAHAHICFLCVGRGSSAFVSDLLADDPSLAGRIHSTSTLPALQTARAIAACDLMIQPFPDGITTRRTSVMGCLINGRPVLTTAGALTESIWARSGGVALAPAGDSRALLELAGSLLADREALAAVGVRGRVLYDDVFAMERTVTRLRSDVAAAAPPTASHRVFASGGLQV